MRLGLLAHHKEQRQTALQRRLAQKKAEQEKKRQSVLHLPIGRYRFIKNGYKNFYNKINFSLTQDGIHNGGEEYTKNVFESNNSGFIGSYIDIVIDGTSPSPIYFYSKYSHQIYCLNYKIFL